MAEKIDECREAFEALKKVTLDGEEKEMYVFTMSDIVKTFYPRVSNWVSTSYTTVVDNND